MKKIKYAIIGFGGIAEKRIAKEGFGCDTARFSGLKNAELLGVTDVNQARESAAKALNLNWYKSMGEIFADSSIDAVFVATNNASHATVALEAMTADKHVIVEKPIATNITDAKLMIKTAAAKKLALAVDHMMINNAYNHAAQKYIANGKIGAVNDSCFHMEFPYGYDSAEAATWRCSKIEEMGGPIGDVASHCFYVAEYIFGCEIVRLGTTYLPKLMDIKAEDGAYIKFEMSNGMRGSIKVAFSEPRGGLIGNLSNLGYEIYGDTGVLRGYGTMFQLSGHTGEPYKIRLDLENADGIKSIHPRKIVNIYQEVIEAHAKSIMRGKPMNAEAALHNLELCQAAHQSAKNGGKFIKIK